MRPRTSDPNLWPPDYTLVATRARRVCQQVVVIKFLSHPLAGGASPMGYFRAELLIRQKSSR